MKAEEKAGIIKGLSYEFRKIKNQPKQPGSS